MERFRRFAPAVFLTLAGCLDSTGLQAAVWPPQNQCPGDCSPCLGEDDPFCDPTDTDGGGGGIVGYFCELCDKGACRDAKVGETGKDSSCTVTTVGMTVISCVTQGNACNGIAAITP